MITPTEIRQHSFKKVLRGYDKEEVHAFLLALSHEWEQQLEAQRNLKEEMSKLQASYKTLKEVEDMLHKTLMQAEQSSRDTIENARQKAELRLREAESRAHEIVKRGIEDRNNLQKEIEEFSRRRDQILTQLRVFLKTQLDRLESFELVELPPARRNGNVSTKLGKPDENLFGAADNDSSDTNLLDDIMDEL
ncbi:MAG: DivIVA domain-containing protein [Bacteroidetes bacterium]|nr:DivIVA domain-containing protein [Bacteroidota bacterium]